MPTTPCSIRRPITDRRTSLAAGLLAVSLLMAACAGDDQASFCEVAAGGLNRTSLLC